MLKYLCEPPVKLANLYKRVPVDVWFSNVFQKQAVKAGSILPIQTCLEIFLSHVHFECNFQNTLFVSLSCTIIIASENSITMLWWKTLSINCASQIKSHLLQINCFKQKILSTSTHPHATQNSWDIFPYGTQRVVIIKMPKLLSIQWNSLLGSVVILLVYIKKKIIH